ncbi:ABC transporter permease [Kutzneria sp. 744]|uniref:ABC transporter permease n=1 Tax=Kutzneria sp. (strain 744) TaxID=345341 RepID=UPI0003EEBCC1|nr:ABC transporter permease subunit [Kutzneria sp. 744]EWM10134.1 ABC transporter permease component [Kutzneria sp. 744]
MATTTLAPTSAPAARAPGFSRPTVTAVLTWTVAGLFAAVLLAVLISVIVTALSTSWGGTWLPSGYTLSWFRHAWDTPGLANSIAVTFEVAIADVAIALLVGVPAGYVVARKKFPGRNAIMLFALLPVILPPLTYAVQLAALMYRLGIGGTLLSVVLVNLVPILPLVILITVPFVEQISPDVEQAAKVFGADNLRLFTRVLVPLLTPGIVAAGVLSLVRVLGSFELTFFVSGATTQTLVVTIFGALSDPGGPPAALTAAMTVFYMAIALLGLVISLRFANPAHTLAQPARRTL